MRLQDRELGQKLEACLISFHRQERPLPGINSVMMREALLEQLLESIRRVRYVSVLLERDVSDCRADPNDERFDPLKAAVLHKRREDYEEAFWLVFLFVHFGKHPRAGWRYAREVYGQLGGPGRWDWVTTSASVSGFREWLNAHQSDLKRAGVPRGFGNHRKYQSLDAYSSVGTGAAVESYIKWVNPPRTHRKLIELARSQSDGDPRKTFDTLYKSMDAVVSFGRTARFDYLTMLGKLCLAPIEPGSTFMKNSTGPVAGARLLFGGHTKSNLKATLLDTWLVELESHLNVGMQVLEDALCNWQKSPGKFIPFRG